MKSWFLPLALGVVAVGSIYFAVAEARPRQAEPKMTQAESERHEPGHSAALAGLKREPGTWKEKTLAVTDGKEALEHPDVTVDIDVMRPVFLPSLVTVKQGQVVKLRLHGKDNGLADTPEIQGGIGLTEFSGHGFQILGPYDVWITGIRKDDTKEVTFKADVAGEFPFECVVFCSTAHYNMQGKLVVTPN